MRTRTGMLMTTSMWEKDAYQPFLAQAPAFWVALGRMSNSPREAPTPPPEEGFGRSLAQCLDLAERNATLRERLAHGQTAVTLLADVNARLRQWIEWTRVDINTRMDVNTRQWQQVDPWMPQQTCHHAQPGDERHVHSPPVHPKAARQGMSLPRDTSQEIMMKVETEMIKHQVRADNAWPGDAASSSDLLTQGTNPTAASATHVKSPPKGTADVHNV